MIRRRELLTGLSTGGLATAALGSISGQSRGKTSLVKKVDGVRSTVGPPPQVDPADWYPHYEMSIEKDGHTSITLHANGAEVPSRLELSDRFVANENFTDGQEAISTIDTGYSWRPDDTNPIEYTVQLGEGYGKQGYFSTGVLDQSIVSNIPEILAVSFWEGGIDSLPRRHRFTINPPSDWVSVAPGKQVGTNTYDLYPNRFQVQKPWDMFIVGDIDVRKPVTDGAELRFVELPSANGPDQDELIKVLVEAQPLLEKYYGITTKSPRLAFVPPPEIEPNGGTMGGDAIAIHDGQPLVQAQLAFLSEQTHTYERFYYPSWQFEGQTTWFMMLLMYEMEEFSEARLREQIGNDVKKGEVTVPVADSVYDKGRVVVGALDIDIRARTDGAADIGDFLRRTNEQRLDQNHLMDRSEQLDALFEITGVDYTPFFERYVDGSDYPKVMFSKYFTIEEPLTTWGNIEISKARVSSQEVLEGETVTVSADVANTGDLWAKDILGLDVRGDEFEGIGQTEVVELEPGETQSVRFEHRFSNPGYYEIAINHVDVATVTVESEPTPTNTVRPTDTQTTTPTDTPTVTSTEASTETTAETPGLGVVAALAGLASATGYLIKGSEGDER